MLCAQYATAPAFALQANSYVPLMQWQGAEQLPVDAWSAKNGTKTQGSGINPATRPNLAGQWPKDVELLQYVLQRKHGRLPGSSNSKARDDILRSYARSPQSAAQLRGIFAEAVYLDKHPNEYHVRKLNAAHNNVYRWDNRAPNGAQIITRNIFSGSGYAAAMKKDYRAKRFIVPDDHVEPLKSYFLEQEHKFQSAGEAKLAEKARLQFAKVRPLGETSGELENRLQTGFRRVLAAKSAPYVSLGAATGGGFAPILWGYANGEITAERTLYQATRASSLIGAGLGSDTILANIKDGALRGSAKGNLITGAAIFAVESGFLVYENGGARALQEARFWEELGGSASALTLGIAVGVPVTVYVTTVLATGTGPAAPFVGGTTGILVGSLVGMAGYVGGKSLTRVLLDTAAPEIARKAERESIAEIRKGLNALEKKVATLAMSG